jgi:hypothetical protein
MLAYMIKLTPDDNGTFLVTCPAFAEVTTFGETTMKRARLHPGIRKFVIWPSVGPGKLTVRK